MGRIVLFVLTVLTLVGCSAPEPARFDPMPADVAPTAAPPALASAEAHPTELVIDETFNAWDQAAILDSVASWCALEPTLCLTVTVGPVAEGQANTFWRDTTTADCPYYGVESRDTAQMSIPDSCATLETEHHLTTGEIATHELGHFFGALHVAQDNTMMNGEGPRHMARCITSADLAEVCSFNDCTAPRFDLVCSDAEAAASNPYTPFN